MQTIGSYEEAVRVYGSGRKAAKALGLEESVFRRRLNRERDSALGEGNRRLGMRGMALSPTVPHIPSDGMVIGKNSITYDDSGNLLRQSVQFKPDSGDVYEVPDGHVVKGESVLLDPDNRVLAKWIKTREGAGEGLVDALKEAFDSYDGMAGTVPLPLVLNNDLLTVYPIPDLHFGMYGWAQECGADYDVEIASKIITESLNDLIERSAPSTKAVILGLGDHFHANDSKAATPGSGNRLDVDTRWARVFGLGARLTTLLVDMVARKHKYVEVKFLPGNHDPDSSMALTVALSLFYSKNDRIYVNDDPSIAWYYRFGKVLMGATHGHSMPPARMAMILANDRAKDWGETEYRHLFYGHFHRRTAEEIGPVIVESFASPAARDAWNANSGYRSGRRMTAITFHKDFGEISRHTRNIV